MKNLFKEAHKITREFVEKYEVDYQAQFGLCLSFLFEEEEEEEVTMVELEGSDNQVAWAEDIREEKLADFERWVIRWTQRWEKEGNEEELTYIDELRKKIYKVSDSSKWIWLKQMNLGFTLLLSPKRREEETTSLESFF